MLCARPRPTREIACAGDSLSDVDFRTNTAWTYWLPTYLQGVKVQSHGVSGNTPLTLLARLGTDGQIHTYEESPYFGPPRPCKGTCFIMCGVNDLVFPGRTQAQIIADLTACYAWCDANGFDARPMTITPFGAHTNWTTAVEAIRVGVNSFITGLTARRPINLEPHVANNATAGQPKLITALAAADGLHFSILGAQTVACKVALSI